MIRSYKDLEIWQIGIILAKEIYKISKKLPKEEIYGLSAQMRRAAVSIPSNIAEGHQRQHQKEFRQFLYHSLGSLAELETQLVVLDAVYHIRASKETIGQMNLLGKKIRTLIKKVNTNNQ